MFLFLFCFCFVLFCFVFVLFLFCFVLFCFVCFVLWRKNEREGEKEKECYLLLFYYYYFTSLFSVLLFICLGCLSWFQIFDFSVADAADGWTISPSLCAGSQCVREWMDPPLCIRPPTVPESPLLPISPNITAITDIT